MFRALLATAQCLVCLPAMAREDYAILIGANQYRNLDERWWLKGPALDPASVLDGQDELFLQLGIGPWSDQVAPWKTRSSMTRSVR